MRNRHARILEFALTSIGRHKARCFMTIGVYVFVVFTFASALFMTEALKSESKELLSNSPELIVQRVSAGRHAWIPAAYAEGIQAIRGVQKVVPRHWGYYFDPPPGTTYTLMGADRLDSELLTLIDGDVFSSDQPFGCVIGKGIAEVRMLEPEDIIPVKGADGKLYVLRVCGIFVSSSELLTNDLIVLSVESWRKIFSVPEGLATDLVVHVPNSSEIDVITRKILERFPDVRSIRKDMVLRTYEALFDWRSSLLVVVFLGALAAFGIFCWDKASGPSSDEARTIGILKAIGWDVSDVMELKFWEGFVISSVSFLTGVILAHLHVFYLGCWLFAPFLKGWSVLFPAFQLKPTAETFQILSVFFLTVVPYVLVNMVPAWRAAITDPDEAMRR